MSILDDLMSVLGQGQGEAQKRQLFGALNRTGTQDETPGALVQRSLMGGDQPMQAAAMAPALPQPVTRSPLPPVSNLGGPQSIPQPAASPSPRAPQPQGGSGYTADRLGAFARGYGTGGLIGAIADATGGSDRKEQSVNETYQYLVRKGLPEADARAVIQNPTLMQQILPGLVGPKSAGTPMEIYDEKTGQPMKVILKANGSYAPIGGAKAVEPKRVSVTEMTPAEREAVARQYGLDPNSDAGRAFTLTGKLPREDQQLLTATDKKFIEEADDKVLSNTTAIKTLQDALKLSGQAYDGASANERAWLTSQFGNAAGEATREFNNLLTQTALEQLKATFGAAPTEGERKILLEIQGAAELPQRTRENIINRAIAMAEKKLAFNKDRAAQLRGGTFYKPQTEGGPKPAPSGLGGAPVRAKNAKGDVIEFNGKEWVPVQ